MTIALGTALALLVLWWALRFLPAGGADLPALW